VDENKFLPNCPVRSLESGMTGDVEMFTLCSSCFVKHHVMFTINVHKCSMFTLCSSCFVKHCVMFTIHVHCVMFTIHVQRTYATGRACHPHDKQNPNVVKS